jgi:hypothetical protein
LKVKAKENLIEKWTTALKSGRYKQNKNSLISRDGCSYCVIGVLCDVIDPFAWRVYYDKSSEKNFVNPSFSWRNYSYTTIPHGISRLLCNEKIDLSFVRDLSLMNDKGFSFETLAAIIEDKVRQV